jgi:glycogen(starch) synthase
LRILVVTNMYPPHHFGGYELSCEDAVRRFGQAGHEVSVLTSRMRLPGVDLPDEPAVHRQLQLYWRDHVVLSPAVPQCLRMELANRRALKRAVTSMEPDVVSVWNMGALSLGMLSTLREMDVPVVYVLADDWPNYAPELDAWSRRFRGQRRAAAGRWFTRLTGIPTTTSDFSELGACIFYSRSTMEAVEAGSSWSMPRRGIVFSGVEPDDFPVLLPEAPVADRRWDWRLLYVGRIDERKGIDTILRALPGLPAARLRVVGRGDDAYLGELRSLAASLGVVDRVTFTSRGRSELRAEYSEADVLIFSSVYEEPFGIVPLEAMACDTPVVATGTGGSGEYLADGWNSLLYPAGNDVGLTGAVERLAADAELRQTLVRGGRATAAALTTEAWMHAVLDWHLFAENRFQGDRPPDRALSFGAEAP